MRTTLAQFFTPLLLLAIAAPASALDLPVRRPGQSTPAPCWAGDVLEVTLTPAAVRAARIAGDDLTRAVSLRAIGLADLDAAAADLAGVLFTPEFAGEGAPASALEHDFGAHLIAHLPPGVSLERAIERLRALPSVAGVERIAILPVSAVPNDSLFARQLSLYQPGNRRDAHAPEAWDVERGDSAIVLSVIDTGMLPDHPDLGGRGGAERGNRFVNAAEAGGVAGVDDDGNGFVDDVSGWDFVAFAAPPSGVLPGEDWQDADADPNDYAGHGTAVAGVAGAIGDNGIGVAGTAWRVRLLPLRIGWATNVSPLGEIRMDFAAAAIRYATRMGAHVINASFASVNTNGVDAAVAAAARAGTIVVVASGNNNSPNYLGTRDDVIAVSATDSNDVVPSFANRFPAVDLCANGVNVTSTFLERPGTDSLGLRRPGYRHDLLGTSFSAPQVAGGLALAQSRRRALGLDPLTPLGAIYRVRETADDIAAQNPSTINYGTGRLNLARLLSDPPRSLAIRGGARTSGPPVVARVASGGTRVYHVTTDRRLIALSGATGDTVVSAALGVGTAGALAAAELGGSGLAFFVGSTTGRVLGLRADGSPLPGWPALGPGGSATMAAGPVVGDVDGDGSLEVVGGGTDGRVWLWRADGARARGWPFDPFTLGAASLALADLDGLPGDEVIAVDGAGVVHVLKGDTLATELWSVPLSGGAMAPVVARLGGAAAPVRVIVATASELVAFDPDGSIRWTQGLASALTTEPVPADFDGDGTTELLLSFASPAHLELRDSTGAPIVRAGWPRTLTSAPLGAVVAGPLPGAGTGVALVVGGQVVLLDGDAQSAPGYPRPGTTAGPLALAELDGDGATEVVAGSAPDSTLLVHDAGAGTWNASRAAWPASRGSMARTGSALGARAFPELDDVPPATPGGVTAVITGERDVIVRWITSGDDGTIGRAATVEITETTAGRAPVVLRRAAADALAPDSARFDARDEGRTYDYTVRVLDEVGQASAAAGPASVTIPARAPFAVSDLAVSAAAETSVSLRWTATGGDGDVGRPRRYRVFTSRTPIASSADTGLSVFAFDAAVDAGGSESAVIAPLARATRWWFAIEAEDSTGLVSPLSSTITAITGVGGALKDRFGLALAPRGNPARLPVTLDWQSAPDAIGQPQRLRLHDVTGRLVRTFDLGTGAGGTLTWDGRDSDGRRIPAGLYFARLESGSFRISARVALAP